MSHDPDEMWRPAVGWEGVYEVSNLGRVRRSLAASGTRAGRIMKIPLSSHGYPRVSLSTPCKHAHVHTLVAFAFIGPRPEGMEINHKDGNKQNNRWDNLEYVTPRENAEHAVSVLGYHRGERNGLAKLSEKDVIRIRSLWPQRSQTDIAREYGVTPANISFIVNRKGWKHVA